MKKIYFTLITLLLITSCSSGPSACECYEGYRGETRVLQTEYTLICGKPVLNYEACFDKFYPELKGKRNTYEQIHNILKNECGKTAFYDTGSNSMPFPCER